MKKMRNSNLELLRIVSMWFIIFYHLHIHVLSPESGFFKGIQLPLHVAVVCFVMISGYFGINFKIKSLCRFISNVFFYSLFGLAVVSIYGFFVNGSARLGLIDFFSGFFCFSQSNLWFAKTYLYLFLIAPFFNKIIIDQSRKSRLALLLVLGLISIYMGSFGHDESVHDGKNLINFLFIYTVGWSLKEYKVGNKLKSHQWLILYSVLFFMTFILFLYSPSIISPWWVWRVSFPYNSPLLILGSIFFFLAFERLKINSNVVNYLASSMFAVYLLHEGIIGSNIIYPALISYSEGFDELQFYLILFVSSFIIFISCVIIDKLCHPLQVALASLLERYLVKIKGLIINRDK